MMIALDVARPSRRGSSSAAQIRAGAGQGPLGTAMPGSALYTPLRTTSLTSRRSSATLEDFDASPDGRFRHGADGLRGPVAGHHPAACTTRRAEWRMAGV